MMQVKKRRTFFLLVKPGQKRAHLVEPNPRVYSFGYSRATGVRTAKGEFGMHEFG
jgi:hypothetical protein